MNDTPSADQLTAELRTLLPGLEWRVTEDGETVMLQARRRVEYIEGGASVEFLTMYPEAAPEVVRRLVETAQRKAIADYGLDARIATEREDAAREARREVMAMLRAKIDEHREYIDALDEHGAIVKVRGPLRHDLAELRAWASGA